MKFPKSAKRIAVAAASIARYDPNGGAGPDGGGVVGV